MWDLLLVKCPYYSGGQQKALRYVLLPLRQFDNIAFAFNYVYYYRIVVMEEVHNVMTFADPLSNMGILPNW